MTSGDIFNNSTDLPYPLNVQRHLQIEAQALANAGCYSDAVEQMAGAAGYRDEFVATNTDHILAVQAAVNFNEALHTLLEHMVGTDNDAMAEDLAASRLRTTADPYEASGLHYWIAMNEAQAGNFRTAVHHAKSSEQIAENIGSPWLAAQVENMQSRLYEDLGDETLAQEALVKALDNVERGARTNLYTQEKYKLNTLYGVNHRLRYYLAHRLFWDRERSARDFCNEVLTTTSNPNRRGLFHHWMGQAEIMHTKPIGHSGRFRDVTQAAIHLKAAEDYFVIAGEPVYAGMVVIDQGELGDMPAALERSEKYARSAIDQYTETEVPGLAIEIDDLMRQIKRARLGTFVTNN